MDAIENAAKSGSASDAGTRSVDGNAHGREDGLMVCLSQLDRTFISPHLGPSDVRRTYLDLEASYPTKHKYLNDQHLSIPLIILP